MIEKASILIQEYTKSMNSITLIISHQDASAYLAIDQRIQIG